MGILDKYRGAPTKGEAAEHEPTREEV
jgi:hypothetical protein